MKHKFLTLASSAAFVVTMLTSCSQTEEPIVNVSDSPDVEGSVEYTLTIHVADEVRTRDLAEGSIGENGLLDFFSS